MQDERIRGDLPVGLLGRADACDREEEQGYGPLFDRVFDRIRRLEATLSREREHAPSLLQQVLPHPPARRMLMVRNSSRFSTVGFCETSLEAAWEARFDDPERSLSLADLAVAVADRLDGRRYDPRMVEDLQGRSWSHLANARRILADLEGAVEALRQADAHLQRGSRDGLERGFWLRMKANLLGDRGDLERAEALLDQALTIYRDEGFQHEMGMTLLTKSHFRESRDDTAGEIRCLKEAFPLLDQAREPRVKLVAVHNLAFALHRLGRNPEALALLIRWRFLYFEFGDRTFLLRLHWLEGTIARDMGRHEMAEGALQEARKGFIQLSLPYEVALVSLELCELYLVTGSLQEVRELASEMIAFFRSRQIAREGLAALLLFRDAVRREQASVDLVHRLADYLDRARQDPEARFQPDV